MMVLWIGVEIMFLLFFYHLPRLEGGSDSHNRLNTKSVESHDHPSSHMTKTIQSNSFEGTKKMPINEDGETSPLLQHTDPTSDRVSVTVSYNAISNHSPTPTHGLSSPAPRLSSPASINSSCSPSVETESDKPPLPAGNGVTVIKHVLWALSEMVREEIVVLLSVLFAAIFSQVSVEVGYCMVMIVFACASSVELENVTNHTVF